MIITKPLPNSCVNFQVERLTSCLEVRRDCADIADDTSLVPLSELWNDSKCRLDQCYFIPYAEGDMFYVQTRFNDPGRENPTHIEISFSLIEPDGTIVETDEAAIFQDSMYAWNGVNSYQVFQINPEIFTPSCWRIQFEYEGLTFTTQFYQMQRDCTSTVLAKGYYPRFDCLGNFYGEPVAYSGPKLYYDNAMRFYLDIQDTDATVSKNTIGSRPKPTAVTVVNNWTVRTSKFLPPPLKRELVEKILAGEIVYFDGIEFEANNISITKANTGNNMHWFEIKIARTCYTAYSC